MDTLRTGVIYGLYSALDPDCKIRYVGQTLAQPNRRLNQHRHEARNPYSYLAVHRWARSIGPENVRQAILETGVSRDCLDDRETAWIATYRTFRDWGEGGLNLTADGRGSTLTDQILKRKKESMRLSQLERSTMHLLRNRPEMTPSEVIREIREQFEHPDVLVVDLAREYSLTKERIERILLNEEWLDPQYAPPTTLRKTLSDESRRMRKSGERRGGTTWARADEIRKVWLQGDLTALEIGDQFNLDSTTIWHIVNNRTWPDPGYTNTRGRAMPESVRGKISQTLKGRPKPEGFGKRGEENHTSKLTRSQVEQIIQELNAGSKGYELGDKYGVSYSTISCIKNGKTWTDLERPWSVK